MRCIRAVFKQGPDADPAGLPRGAIHARRPKSEFDVIRIQLDDDNGETKPLDGILQVI